MQAQPFSITVLTGVRVLPEHVLEEVTAMTPPDSFPLPGTNYAK